ncbi:MAG: histidine kinase dimerization/phosphoacceptor domain -containing protein [Crocinitomicaceae bacterium]
MNYIGIIEELSKSKYLHEGEIENFARELLVKSSLLLGCERCNSWVFNESGTVLRSLLGYSVQTERFSKEQSLNQSELPNYFKFIRKNEIIVSADAQKEPMNSELLATYLFPNNIMSMVDVPLRSEGKIIGVICFEHVKKKHIWTSKELKFTQSIAQLLSLALETKEKISYRKKLEKIIQQKEVLIAEINHRVKNNMAVILSLLNFQKEKAKDQYHSQLFSEFRNKVYSMAVVQQQLYSRDDFDCIELGQYIKELTENIYASYSQEQAVCVELNLDTVEVDVLKAIPCGLIVNEILTNSYKYAFGDKNLFPTLKVTLVKKNNQVEIVISDNGDGFNSQHSRNGMGLELVTGLAEQIDGSILINSEKGVQVELIFSLDKII